jgi:ATP-dependent exoDNAse (exonuclease V) alpha subunit
MALCLAMAKSEEFTFSEQQARAFELMSSGENVFLTGGAGSGKSYLVRALRQQESPKTLPILASTGSAAVLVGGRTFHSFFGLGIMEGGLMATVDKASRDRRVMKRVSEVDGFILDEVSMISAEAFMAAEAISRAARASRLPWGGLRVIVVGDFAQLPPVSRSSARDWAFLSPTWQDTGFRNCLLTHNHRVAERDFLDILAQVRNGKVNSLVQEFLESKVRVHDPEDSAVRLFPRRDQADQFNQQELAKLPGKMIHSESIYLGEPKYYGSLKKQSPVPEVLNLKIGARVMFVQNDPQKRWVNGTRGTLVDIQGRPSPEKLVIEKDHGREVSVEKSMFSMLDADGNIKASLLNFPILLAYATTIHKSQGATLDDLWVDLGALWEPGHAYVALSRLRTSDGLRVLRWSNRSFVVDPQVIQFYQRMEP